MSIIVSAMMEGVLADVESTAKNIANRNIPQPGGTLVSPSSEPASQSRSKPVAENAGGKKLAASSTLNNKLQSMGTQTAQDSGSAPQLGEISAAVKTMGDDIKSLKTAVLALAGRKEK